MNPDLAQLPAQTLMQHGQFVRALARGLLGDEHLAEDVAQDTWLRWMQRPPREPGRTRHWLRSVGRNLAVNSARSRAWRRQRERTVARPEATPDPSEELAQAEVVKTVVDALLSLDEPYRSTLLMTYFRGWSAPRVATAAGVSAATVRTRLRHGLARLRSQLEQRSPGEGRDWGLALGTLAGVTGSEGTRAGIVGSLGALALPLKLLAAGLLVTLGLWVAFGSGGRDPVGTPALGARSQAAPALQTQPTAIETPSEAAGEERSSVEAAVADNKLRFEGRVVDRAYPELEITETPSAGLEMRVAVGPQRAFGPPTAKTSVTLDEEGRFECELDDPGTRPLMVSFSSQASGRHQGLRERHPIAEDVQVLEGLELHRAANGFLSGIVVDDADVGLPGLPLTLANARERQSHSLTTDDDGRFRVELDWRVEQVSIDLRSHSVVDFQQPFPLTGEDERPIGGWTELRILALPAASLEVTVVDASGQGMPTVDVRAGLYASEASVLDLPPRFFGGPNRSGRTDSEGRVRLDGLWADRRLELKLSRRGESHTTAWASESSPAFEADEDATPIVLSAGETRALQAQWGPDFELEGIVRDSSGQPVGGAQVIAHDMGRELPYQHKLVKLTTEEDGTFRERIRRRVLIGPLLVIARGPQPEGGDESTGLGEMGYVGGSVPPRGGTACAVELELAAAVERVFTAELRLQPTHAIEGTIRIADGQASDASPSRSRIWAVPAGAGAHYAPTVYGKAPGSLQDDGHFEFWGLPAGLYDIYVSREIESFYSFSSFMDRFPDIRAGSRGVELTLPEPETVQIKLRVHSEDASRMIVLHGKKFPREQEGFPKPLAPTSQTIRTVTGWPVDAALHFTGISGGDDESGRSMYGLYGTGETAEHTLPAMGPGWYVIGVDLSDENRRVAVPMAAELQYYEAGEYTIDFHPTPTTSVEGRIVAGRPMALSVVDARGGLIPLQTGAQTKDLVYVLESAASGRFRLRDVPVGTFRVRVGTSHELEQGQCRREFEVDFADSMQPLDLRL